MTAHKSKPLIAYRRRLKRHGVVRVEVHVRKNDAPLIRGVAQALSDPAKGAAARWVYRDVKVVHGNVHALREAGILRKDQ